jgi:hypothetical protein
LIYNPIAIDYLAGLVFYDCKTLKTYEPDELKHLPGRVRMRICIKGRKLGCYVKSAVESRKIIEEREDLQ